MVRIVPTASSTTSSSTTTISNNWWTRRFVYVLLCLGIFLILQVWNQHGVLFSLMDSTPSKTTDVVDVTLQTIQDNNNNNNIAESVIDKRKEQETTTTTSTSTNKEQETTSISTNKEQETTSISTNKEQETTTTTTTEKKKKKMNVLLLYADDWTHDTLGAAGNTVVQTPVLDQLAKEGIRFTQNCVTTSICWCSRATLFTGLYTARHNTTLPQQWPFGWKKALYQLFKDDGYSVAHAGKLGIWTDYTDLKLDFFTNDDGWHKQTIGGKEWHVTEKNEADSLRYLRERDTNKPFFLNTAFFATHAVDGDKRQYLPMDSSLPLYNDTTVPTPKTATQEAWEAMPPFFDDRNEGRTRWKWRFDTPEKFQSMMKNYYRMATEVDTAAGNIIAEIKRQGEWDNTLVIFTTDNGNFHAQHGLADKWYPHQESLRVPLIIRDPRMTPDQLGTINEEFTLNIDLAPTLLTAANIPIPPHMMGRDMSTLWLNQKDEKPSSWRTEFFYEHPASFAKDFIPASEALVRKDYKYFYWPQYEYEQLFHIPTDPHEEYDLLHLDDATKDAVSSHKNETEIQSIVIEMRNRFQELKGIIHSDQIVTL